VSIVVMALGISTAISWAASLQPGSKLLPALFVANPITAAAYIMVGTSLWRVADKGRASGLDIPAVTLAALVAFLGAVQLGWHLVDPVAPGITRLAESLSSVGVPHISRMPPNTALCVLFMGVALLLSRVQVKGEFPPGQALALTSGLIALIALVGHTYSVPSLYRFAGAPMSFVSALGTALFSVGFLASQPDRGLMTVITSPTSGGAMARRLLPAAVLMPWLLGAFLLVGGQHGLFEQQFSVAVFAILSIAIFSGLAFWNAKLLYGVDAERGRSERRLLVQHRATKIVAETPALAEAMAKVLSSICATLGWQIGAMWLLDPGAPHLRLAELRTAAGMPPEGPFVEETRRTFLERGKGVPGRVWATGRAEWIVHVASEPGCPRTQAALHAGLQSALYIPVRLGQEMVGLMEFLSTEVHQVDEVLMEMLGSVGTQMALFVERSRAEEQLRRTTANLERSNTELEQFAYVASHDLLEPLRAVTSYLQLLKERYSSRLDPTGLQFISYATEGAERMRALINDLLAYSRVDSRGRALEPIESEQALAAALSNLKVAIEETQATIRNGSLPSVRADLVQLTQLFQNLIANGLKFHGTDAPRIDIGATRRDSEWVFHVRDNGIGIDPKHFERIFVIFQRLHTRREYAGTGIGLAICKKIVERHGGRIWVESSPGQGSTFLFTLPALGK
jgi:signal transduction histidine kinase